jgi:hypothetical protein
MAEPLCQCGEPSSKRTKASDGREYWVCASGDCQFFAWDDTKGTVLTQAGPTCRCGVSSRRFVSKKPQSAGRCVKPLTGTSV